MGLRSGWDTPRLVAVETTNHCNAKCVFCPNNALARDKGPMADDLFDKIIEDCREFELPAIEPFIQGDPFSDPKILPRLEQIRRRLPKTKLRLYTNGYGMTPKKTDAMLELGIDHLYISVNTLDEKKYRDVMGIPLERTLRNMDYITQPGIRERIANKITLRMTRLGDTTLQEQGRLPALLQRQGRTIVHRWALQLQRRHQFGPARTQLWLRARAPPRHSSQRSRHPVLHGPRRGAWLGRCQQAQRARALQSPAGHAISRLPRQRAAQRDRPLRDLQQLLARLSRPVAVASRAYGR